MAIRLAFHPEAEREIETVSDWYEEQSHGLGADFIREVVTVIEALQRHPEMYPAFSSGYHRALLRRFPYQVLYYLAAGEVLIAGVWHQHQEPTAVAQAAATRQRES